MLVTIKRKVAHFNRENYDPNIDYKISVGKKKIREKSVKRHISDSLFILYIPL